MTMPRCLPLLILSFCSISATALASERAIVHQFGHARLQSVAFSGDGKLVVTAGDASVIVWNRRGDRLYEMLHEKLAYRAVLSPDGQRIASTGDDGLRLWDRNGKLLLHTKAHIAEVDTHNLSFSPDGRFLLVSDTRYAKLIDVKTLEVRAIGKNRIMGAVFSGDHIVAFRGERRDLSSFRGNDKAAADLQIFQRDGKLLSTTALPKGTLFKHMVAAGPKGISLLSQRKEKTWLQRFDPRRRKVSRPVRLTSKLGELKAIHPSPNGKLFIGLTRKGEPKKGNMYLSTGLVVLYDHKGRIKKKQVAMRGLAPIGVDAREVESSMDCPGFTRDGQWFVAIRYGLTGRQELRFGRSAPMPLGLPASTVRDAQVSPNQELILVRNVAPGGSDQAAIWSADGRLLSAFRSECPGYPMAWSPDSKHVALGGTTCVEIRTTAGHLVRKYVHGAPKNEFAEASTAKHVMLGGADGTDLLAVTRTQLRRAARLSGSGYASESGKHALIAANPGGKSFIMSTAKKKPSFNDAGIYKVFFFDWKGKAIHEPMKLTNPEGLDAVPAFAEVGKRHLQLWGYDGVKKARLSTKKTAKYLTGSYDGKRFAFAEEKMIVIADPETGKRVHSFSPCPSTTCAIGGLRFGHTTRRLLATIYKKGTPTFVVFDESGKRLGAVESRSPTRSNGLISAAFGPHDNTILGTSGGSITSYRPSLVVVDYQSGKRVNLISDGDAWIAVSNDGYYDSSRNGGALVRMVEGDQVYAIDQFALRNNRPDLLLERLGSKDKEAQKYFHHLYRKRLRRAGQDETALSEALQPPVATIASHKKKGSWLSLKVELSDAHHDLKRFNIFVNDVPLFGALGEATTGRSQKISRKIELGAGRNKVEVSATNTAGIESFRMPLMVQHRSSKKGDLHVVAFGVSAYQDEKLKLDFAHKDAQDIAAALAKRSKGVFRQVKTHVFTDAEVTRERITAAKKLLEQTKVNDTVVLFVAGHGMHARDESATWYYLTHGTKLEKLSETAVPFEAVEELLQGIPARQKLFLLDACESGEAEPDQIALLASDQPNLRARGIRRKKSTKAVVQKPKTRSWLLETDRFIFNDLVRRSGAIVFSSSRGGELSYESAELGNGFFTDAIIGALSSSDADTSKDGRLSLRELRLHVRQVVSKKTAGVQNPVVDRDNISLVFDLSRIL